MASQPKSDIVETVGEVLAIPVDQIDASDRLRPIDEDWATRLGEMMLADGQRTPIEVCRLPGRAGYRLVAGGHRHRAHELFPALGPVKAIVVDAERLSRRIAEISENLHRKDLEPIERATFLSELVATKKAQMGVDPSKDGRSVSAAARWQQQLSEAADDTRATIALAYGWNDQVAETVGLSTRTVKNDLMLIRRLQPASIDALQRAKHPIMKNASQLLALAKREPGEQTAIVSRMCVEGLPSLIDAAKAVDTKPVQSAEDKRLSAFIGAFSRMSLAEKKGALAQLAGMVPAGHRLVEGDDPSAEMIGQAKQALDAAMTVLVMFIDGEPVDDDMISDTAGEVQSALQALGGAA